MKFLLLLTFLTLFAQPAWPLVNMRNGSYTERWVDFIEPQPGVEMKVERYYSSRSLFDGVFGFGWCSKFETKLDITSDGILNLKECGGGLEIPYFPNNFDTQSANATIEAIVAYHRKKYGTNLSELANLKTQLRASPKLRFKYANIINGEECPPTKDKCLIDIQKIKTRGNVFYAKVNGYEKIIFDGQQYTRKKADGTTEIFNLRGQLKQRIFPSGLFIKVTYKHNKIKQLRDNVGRLITFRYRTDGVLQSISNGQGLTTTYRFEGDDLVYVKNMWQKEYFYSYDTQHNMTGVKFPDGTTLVMRYNLSRDWIKEYRNRVGCVEKFDFSFDKDKPHNYYGTFSRRCGNGKTYYGRHSFYYDDYKYAKGEKYLSRVLESYKIKTPGQRELKDVTFHLLHGRPTSIIESNPEITMKRRYIHFDSGLVYKRETQFEDSKKNLIDWKKIYLKYNKESSQILQSKEETLDKNEKVIALNYRRYQYNKRGQLIGARNQAQQFVSLQHNKTGKLSQISNEKKHQVNLSYQVGTDKPVEMTDPALGSVKITYGKNGEVERVMSPSKRNIATSVIEKFIQMVKFLGPLGEQLLL